MINGFIVIDKPAGITSHDVVSRVRRILGTRKVGHTGTLDPFATGVLPIAINEGTKAIPFLDEGVKRYDALMRFGVVTDTLDMTGSVLSEKVPHVERKMLDSVLSRFTGILKQIPPMFSAIKLNGQPLYKLARQGVEVERETREVAIHSLELLLFDGTCARIVVTCSRGTYIRSLAADIGRELGCGASLQELRRTASGPFSLSASVSLEELEQAVEVGNHLSLCVTPYQALCHLPSVQLDQDQCAAVRNGRVPALTIPELFIAESTPLVRLADGEQLVAVAGRGEEGRWALKRVFH